VRREYYFFGANTIISKARIFGESFIIREVMRFSMRELIF
jgi:hypothetical protein